MIGFFTDPYPDELLYSACARYHHRARNLSKPATTRDLFGKGDARVVVDFPTRLGYLAAQLPLATYSTDRLIDEYTMMPLYSPFMPTERHRALRHDMRGEGGGSLHGRLGILTSGIDVKHLRFCLACSDDDGRYFGEPYWHRVHQAPGVEVCPTHAVSLLNSEVQMRSRVARRAFITAKQAITESLSLTRQTHQLDPKNQEHMVLLSVARDAAWLLNAKILPDQNTLRRRYLCQLFDRNLATHAGTVTHRRLNEQFRDYYSPKLLERLGCGLKSRNNWLRYILYTRNQAHHPLHHLLLMQFLGVSAEEFFRLPTEVEPFGKGPWECLNPAAVGHYKQACITDCQIGYSYHGRDDRKSRLVMGTFRCDCGFSYRRIGRDETEGRRLEYDRIVSFGQAWYAKLNRMLTDGNYSRPRMARALGVSPSTVAVEIARLKRAHESDLEIERGFQQPYFPDPDLRERHRKRWSEEVAANPNVGRSELGRMAARETYCWLLKYDKKWFEDNSPARRRKVGTAVRIDWSQRDESLSAAIPETASKILKAAGRPVRASSTRIATELGILEVLRKKFTRLPLTAKTLEEVSESQTSFIIRRIRWAADCYRQANVPANRWKLQNRAGVSNRMSRNPVVKAAYEECAQALREMSERGWRVQPVGEASGHVEITSNSN